MTRGVCRQTQAFRSPNKAAIEQESVIPTGAEGSCASIFTQTILEQKH